MDLKQSWAGGSGRKRDSHRDVKGEGGLLSLHVVTEVGLLGAEVNGTFDALVAHVDLVLIRPVKSILDLLQGATWHP